MGSFISIQIPAPSNWQDFERLMRLLYTEILKDPQTQRNGREGQRQNGVDIYGRRNSKGGHWVGIQCKGKNQSIGKPISKEELREEVEKAKKFKPALKEFILVTTAPHDEAIQAEARKISDELESSKVGFSVSVFGWQEIEDHLLENEEILRKFYPEIWGTKVAPVEEKNEIRTDFNEIKEELSALRKDLFKSEPLGSIDPPEDTSSEAEETLDKALHRQVDSYRDLLNEGKQKTSLDLMEKMLAKLPNGLERVKFRLFTNIGAAKLSIGDEEGAIEAYFEANKFDKKDKLGIANIAMAYMLQEKFDEAIDYGKTKLKEDPKNEHLASYLIQALANKKEAKKPESLIPKPLMKTEGVRSGLVFFYRKRLDNRWREVALSHPFKKIKSDYLKKSYAEAILDLFLENEGFRFGGKPKKDMGSLRPEVAIKILEEIWVKEIEKEANPKDPTLPQNLCQSFRLIGDNQKAWAITEKALEYFPDDNELKKANAILGLMNGGDFEEILEKLQKIQPDCETEIIKAEILIGEEKFKEADKVLINFKWKSCSEQLNFQKEALELESLVRQETKLDKVKKALVTFQKNNSENILSHLMASQLATKVGLLEIGEKALNDCLGKISPKSSYEDVFQISEYLLRRGRYSDVVDLLKDRVDYSRNSVSLKFLIKASISSENRNLTHKIFEQMPKRVAELPEYLRLQMFHFLAIGNLSKAEKLARKFLKLRPDDLEIKLKLARILFRQGEEHSIKKMMEASIEKSEGHPEDKMELAGLLARSGFYGRAMSLAYETLLKNPENPSINQNFTSLVFLISQNEKDYFEIEKINEAAGFIIKNQAGETHTFLVETDKKLLPLKDNFIEPDHEIYKATKGLKAGDEFKLKVGSSKEEQWAVQSVRHKYIEIHNKILYEFNVRFPKALGLQKVSIPHDENGNPDFEPIFSQLRARNEHILGVLKQYEAGEYPLRLMGKLLGSDQITSYYGLIDLGEKFRVCIGTKQERLTAIKEIKKTNQGGFLFDALSLQILLNLNLVGQIAELLGKIKISQTTKDIFLTKLDELKVFGAGERMSMYYKDGQYYRNVETKETVDRRISLFEEEIKTINKHCEVVQTLPDKDPDPKLLSTLNEIDHTFLDDIYATQGINGVLVSEDYYYRARFAKEFGVKAVWLQPLLMYAISKDVISEEEYYQAIIAFCQANHQTVSINSRTLEAAVKLDSKDQGNRFEAVIRYIAYPGAELSSHLGVCVEFLRKIWEENPSDISTAMLTSKIFERLMSFPMENPLVLIEKLGDLIPSRLRGYHKHCIAWGKGHFYLPFDTKKIEEAIREEDGSLQRGK